MRTAVVTAVALVLLCVLSAVGGFAHVDFEGDGGGCGTFIERPDSTPDDDPSWDPAGKYHRYGTEPGEFTIGTYFPAFNRIFDLYLTDDVASRWDSTDVAYFINRVIDEDSTNTDDIFPREMPYFTDADEDPRYGYVEYHTAYDDSVYTKFVIKLYSDHDFMDGSCSTYGNYWRECSKYSMAYRPSTGEFPYRAWTVLLLASDETKDCGPLTAITVENVASRGFAHEFQHVCFGLNPCNRFYDSVNESLAKLAEYMTGGDQDKTCDISYDTSILRGERCEPYRKYMAELVWMAYLYDAYQGSPGDPTDDLVYQWIREPDEDVPSKTELTPRSLGNLLSESQFSYLGGATGAERLKNLFQNYSVAKFADAPSFGEGLYGYETFNPLPDLGLMLDNCTYHAPSSCPQRPIDCAEKPKSGCLNHSACWNVKILPPNYVLDDGIENTIASVNGIYEDADESRDSVEVATYGTDYMVFKADSYYASGDHEFHFAMDGRRTNLPSNHELRASVIAYSVADDTLQLHPEHIVFVAPMTISPSSNEASCVVTDFGRSIKAVVICVSLVETVPQYGINSFGYYVYDYDYGVYTPDDISSVEWSGDVFMTGDYTVPDSKTLVVNPGVNVRVWTDDLADTGYSHDAIELNVDGEIEAVGTATEPITFAAWDMTGDSENDDDWTGFFITDNAPATGVFDHVNIKNATKAIQARAAFTIKNSVIEDCKYIGVTIAGDSANADSVYARHLTIRHIGGTGAIGVNALGKKAVICMDSCLVDDCRVGIETYTKAKLYTSHTTVSNSSLYDIWVHGRAYANIFYSSVESAGTTALKISDAASVESEQTTYKTSDFGVDIGAHTGSMPEAVFTSCVFRQNDSGIRVPDLAYVSANDCTVNNNTTGLECFAYADVEWSGSTFKHNTYAVKADASGVMFTYNTVDSNSVGITSDHEGIVTLRGNRIWNSAVAIGCYNYGTVDMDACGGSCNQGCAPDANSVINSSSLHVYNPYDVLDAECNYWGSAPPNSSKFTTSHVDYTPYLSADPLEELFTYTLPEGAKLPSVYSLSQNIPNPFNPVTTIRYEVPAPGGVVAIRIYNVAGQLVKSVMNSFRPAGQYELVWRGDDTRGNSVASGVYFMQMTAPQFQKIRKMVLLK